MDTDQGVFLNSISALETTTEADRKFLFFKWKGRKTVFQLTRPLVYWSPKINGYVVVPKNFWTDFATHPIKLFGFSPPYESNRAAVVHDELYSLRFYFLKLPDGTFSFFIAPKNELWRDIFDNVLREALKTCGIGWIDSWLWFYGVRLGGNGAWISNEESPNLTFDIEYLKTLNLPKELIRSIIAAESELQQF